MRSDTVTKPCDRMRDAMRNAVVGDDVYSDCPTTNRFQQEVADLLGKEASLFVPTGTQANTTSMMTIASVKGESVVMGNLCHIAYYERGGVAGVGGIMPYIVENNMDGTLKID